MAKFTRKEIREIIGESCTEEMENRLMAMHLGVVDPMKDDIARYKADAEKLGEVQSELDALKEKGDGGYKDKYEKEHKAFEDYKSDILAKETGAAKEKAVRAYFEGKNIRGNNLEIAFRGSRDEIAGIELDGEKIKDTSKLDALVSGTFADLASTQTVVGAKPVNPPANNGGQEKKPSRAAQLAAEYRRNLYGEPNGGTK